MVIKSLLFVFTISLVILTSCARTCAWQYQEMLSAAPAYKAAQLTFVPENTFTGIGIQLMKGEAGTSGFFNVYSRQLSSAEGTLWINGQPVYFKGTLLAGGQRLRLPEAVTQAIIQSLLKNDEVIASLPGYSTQLISDNFSDQYHKLKPSNER